MPMAATVRTVMSSAGRASTGGYTLLELLLVLAIVVGVLALSPPMFAGAIAGNEPRSAARQVMAALRYARSTAVASRQDVAFTLDLDRRRYQVDSRPAVALPSSLAYTLITAESEVRDAGSGAIRFYADGSASGGRITLGNDKASYRLDVAWLTGRVTLLE